jgi:hypothetical protein
MADGHGEHGTTRPSATPGRPATAPSSGIDVSVYDAGQAGDGGHAYAFEAASCGEVVLKNGWVEVSPAA